MGEESSKKAFRRPRGLCPEPKRAWSCTQFRRCPTGRKRKGQIKPGDSTAHRRNCLPLLPSGPGGVQQPPVAWVPVLNFAPCAQSPTRQSPQKGIRPRVSGFRVKGTASSPSSTTKLFIETVWRMAEREGFEPSRRLLGRLHDFQSCSFGQLGHLSLGQHVKRFGRFL